MLRKDVIRCIVERETQGQGLTEEIVLQDSPELHQAACEQFGAWDTALQYAGINLQYLSSRQNYRQEQVVQKIRQRCRKGLKPTAKCICRHDYRLQRAAQQHFGTWRHALQAAGVNLAHAGLSSVKPRRLSKDQVLDALRAWNAAGHSLQWADICLQNYTLAIAAKRRFGGWRRVMVAAGIPAEATPTEHKRKWDRQRIIDHIRRRQQEGRPLHHKAVRRDEGGLLHAAQRYFGGWSQALASAEVALSPRIQPEIEHPQNPAV